MHEHTHIKCAAVIVQHKIASRTNEIGVHVKCTSTEGT